MEAIKNNYPYEVLDAERNQIRLLELLPGKEDEPIEGRLVKYSLDDESTPYEALSYRWGSTESTAKIRLDGLDYLITSELLRTLGDLRLKDKVRTIWIDAICINQQDVAERSTQVQKMGRIYSSAAMVRVWLNHEIVPSHPIIKTMLLWDSKSSADDLGDDFTLWEPIIQLGNLSYWTRVWIQQEIYNAREVYMHCRQISFPIAQFACVHQNIVQKRYTKVTNIEDLDSRFNDIKPEAHIKLLGRFLEVKEESKQIAIASALSSQKAHRTLLEALYNTAGTLMSTDPRDQVYGLLGLVQDVEPGDLIVDYKKTQSQVYQDLASFIVQKHSSLSFLAACANSEVRETKNIPSWCPDWTDAGKNRIKLADWQLNAEEQRLKQTSIAPRFLEGGQHLNVAGLRLDRVHKVYHKVARWGVADRAPQLKEWIEVFGDIEASDREHGRRSHRLFEQLIHGEGVENVPSMFSRVLLCLNRGDELETELYRMANKFFVTGVEILGRALQGDNLETPDGEAFKDNFVRLGYLLKYTSQQTGFWQRVMVLTTQGILGHAPPAVEPADEVWAVLGCPVPLLLRPANESYTVIGGCWLDGLMKGQAFYGLPEQVEIGESYGYGEICRINLK